LRDRGTAPVHNLNAKCPNFEGEEAWGKFCALMKIGEKWALASKEVLIWGSRDREGRERSWTDKRRSNGGNA